MHNNQDIQTNQPPPGSEPMHLDELYLVLHVLGYGLGLAFLYWPLYWLWCVVME